jgi:uncharacterized protein YbjT (DUF2867 family)
MTTLVTGGTGTLGKLVVPRLRAAGRDVRVLSRRDGDVIGDLETGEGIAAAVEGAESIVHLAGSAKGDEDKARHLVEAALGSGRRPHVVYISVVGADRVPIRSRTDRAMFGYYGSKHAAERIIAESGLPYTTLRATQFHDLVLTMARGMAKLPVIPAPGLRFQPIDAGEVADRLVELTLAPPAGLVEDMGGPRAYPLPDLIRGYLRATHKHRAIVHVRPPGAAARALREGANLTPEHAVGRRTWEDFLAERIP